MTQARMQLCINTMQTDGQSTSALHQGRVTAWQAPRWVRLGSETPYNLLPCCPEGSEGAVGVPMAAQGWMR